ncbi:M28 family peptidase [Solirubrobacter ginsenosidimutans]|uniref:M28 family peptidase n=1 Tax=Solirubrobacter ginsenosidimutans TaxID=490573 RepID=A0A9X3S5B0_9ACTN|nr:M28 family peptidase [Solirubrobacter ginsenosidimutans]MDA0163981.1 M28 family peptidase [Solirubrobacter ginsenosidimutans]
MRKTVAVLALGLLSVAPAQAVAADPDTTALRNAVTRAEVLRYEQRLNAIGLSNENNRLTASQGNFESVNYVIGELRKIGYNPTLVPYANTSSPNAWSERTPSTLEVVTSPNQTTLPNGKTFVNGTAATSDFAQMTWSQSADITAQVIPAARIQIPPPATADTVRSGCSMSDFPAAVKDNLVLVQRGGCTELVKAINARANGAKGLIIMNEGQTGRTASARYVSQTYPGTVGLGVTYALGQQLYEAAQTGPVTLRFKSDNNLTLRIDYDISAETPGGDPTRVLQVGAHIDGVAAGPGINDDGTGTAMNLTIASQIMKLGITPKYKIRFGWFSGEEQGLFGSTFFVNQLNSLQTTQTLAMLDYDMIASTNWIPFMYVPNDVTEPTLPAAQRAAEATLSKTHIDYLNSKLNVKQVDYPFDNRSDYAQWRRPSATRGVPATGFYTGAEGIKTAAQVADNAASTAGTGGQAGIQADPCYHEWCDTVFNLSQYGLDEFTDVLAHSILSFAGVGADAVEMPIRTDN